MRVTPLLGVWPGTMFGNGVKDYAVKVPEGLVLPKPLLLPGVTTIKAIKVADAKPGQCGTIYGCGGLREPNR